MRYDEWNSTLGRDVEGDGRVCALVGPGVEFKGSIRYDGTVRVDGSVEGEIETRGCLIVGRGAVLNAKVRAGVVVCEGTITGDITAREKIQLRAPAVVEGTVTSPVMSIEEGVLLQGRVEMSMGKVSTSPNAKVLR